MKTGLVEFKNKNDDILRGILTVPETAPGRGAIFLHGFERNATVEKKFRRFAGALAERNVASLRFDAAGCGLSGGDFFKTTLAGRADELVAAAGLFKKEFGNIEISFVAHSLGMCPLALKLNSLEAAIGRMVFLAPALNQRDLMRYYFVRDMMKVKDSSINVVWSNYRNWLDEKKFLEDCARPVRMTRDNWIGPDYFTEVMDIDMSKYFDAIKNSILHVHGEFDRSVPLESLNTVFPNRIIVPAGDHELERPDFWEKWFGKAVDFLAK